jgi:hypothetical protein
LIEGAEYESRRQDSSSVSFAEIGVLFAAVRVRDKCLWENCLPFCRNMLIPYSMLEREKGRGFSKDSIRAL